MSTRIFSRPNGVIDRALFWNGLCVALIALAIVTVFIDALPTNLSIGLCALGVVAGLVGIPLYIAQVLAGWRSGRGSGVDGAQRSTVADEASLSADVVAPTDAAVPADVVVPEGAAVPADVVVPEEAAVPADVVVEDEAIPHAESESVEPESDPSRVGAADEPRERCSCHGLPVGTAPHE